MISHLESSFSFSKHFVLLFGSHKNSVKLCDRYKSVFYTWRDWGQNVNDVPLLSYTRAAPIYISIHSVQRFPFPHILTSICFVSYNFTEFIYLFLKVFFVFFFFLHSLGFSMYEIMSSANRDNFTSAFLVWILSFSCLISLAIWLQIQIFWLKSMMFLPYYIIFGGPPWSLSQ